MVALGLIACTVAIKQEDSHFIKKGSLIYAEDNEAYFLYDVNLMTKKHSKITSMLSHTGM